MLQKLLSLTVFSAILSTFFYGSALGKDMKCNMSLLSPPMVTDLLFLSEQLAVMAQTKSAIPFQQSLTNLIQYRDNQYLDAINPQSNRLLFAPAKDIFAPAHDIYSRLHKYHGALLAVNIISYNQIEGHLKAAQDNNTPIILEVARSQLGYAIDEIKVVKYIREIVKRLNITIPIILHGDHIQYAEKLFKQKIILKEEYEKVYGSGSFNARIHIDDIDMPILAQVNTRLMDNMQKEREVITNIVERLIRAGFTSIAIDASTIYDETAADAVLNYYAKHGTAEEKLIAKLERQFHLPLAWGIKFLSFNTYDESAHSIYEQIRDTISRNMKNLGKPQDEINIKLKEVSSAFGIIFKKSIQANLKPIAVAKAYERVITAVEKAAIAGIMPVHIMDSLSQNEKLLLLPSSNVEETAYQLKQINRLLAEHKPALIGHFGIEIEVGHVDKKVPNPNRHGRLEPKMTNPLAVQVMGDYLTSRDLFFDLIATNNGSGHGTDYDLKTLSPVSQVDKVSPYLTLELQRYANRYNAAIAQHGTTGSSMRELKVLSENGVIKFNVATNYQQIILNILSLMDDGLTGELLIAECDRDKEALVSGLHDKTRNKLIHIARAFKAGTFDIETGKNDSLFIKQIKLTLQWGKNKNKIKEGSSAEEIALILAKEFKRVFKAMDADLYALAHSNLKVDIPKNSATLTLNKSL